MTPRRVVLVGFMASGKSQVGRRLARLLGWRHLDLDRLIEEETGASIETIFARQGEAAFREMERRITPTVTRLDEVVVSTGGGWVTNEGLFESLPQDTLTVWLKVSPDQVLHRVSTSRSRSVRPLLAGSNPRERIVKLLARREAMYDRAAVSVETDRRTVAAIAAELEQIVRTLRIPPPSPPSGSEHDR